MPCPVSGVGVRRYDWARTTRLALFNGLFMGPLGHFYYHALDTVRGWLGSRRNVGVGGSWGRGPRGVLCAGSSSCANAAVGMGGGGGGRGRLQAGRWEGRKRKVSGGREAVCGSGGACKVRRAGAARAGPIEGRSSSAQGLERDVANLRTRRWQQHACCPAGGPTTDPRPATMAAPPLLLETPPACPAAGGRPRHDGAQDHRPEASDRPADLCAHL